MDLSNWHRILEFRTLLVYDEEFALGGTSKAKIILLGNEVIHPNLVNK